MLTALLRRSTLDINVLHDRNPPYVLLSDGSVRNGYTVKILNKLHQPREFTLSARGLEGAGLAIVGMEPGARIRVTTDDLRELKVFVTLPRERLAEGDGATLPFALVVRDTASGHESTRAVNFQRPASTAGRSP
jgi:polyferredoxin